MHDLSEIAGGSPRNIRLRCLSFAPESSYQRVDQHRRHILLGHDVAHLFSARRLCPDALGTRSSCLPGTSAIVSLALRPSLLRPCGKHPRSRPRYAPGSPRRSAPDSRMHGQAGSRFRLPIISPYRFSIVHTALFGAEDPVERQCGQVTPYLEGIGPIMAPLEVPPTAPGRTQPPAPSGRRAVERGTDCRSWTRRTPPWR